MDITELTEPEQLLWKAFRRGAWADFANPGAPSAEIRAEVVTALLQGVTDAEPGHAAGLRLRGATITGSVDLTDGTAACPFICDECRFDDDVVMVDSTMRTVIIRNSRLPGVDGARMRLAGICDLAGSNVTGTVGLEQARVRGQVRLRGTHVGTGPGSDAILASGLSADGGVDGAGLAAQGSVVFEAAVVAGVFSLSNARIVNPAAGSWPRPSRRAWRAYCAGDRAGRGRRGTSQVRTSAEGGAGRRKPRGVREKVLTVPFRQGM